MGGAGLGGGGGLEWSSVQRRDKSNQMVCENWKDDQQNYFKESIASLHHFIDMVGGLEWSSVQRRDKSNQMVCENWKVDQQNYSKESVASLQHKLK